MNQQQPEPPVLYVMCGLPFAGKSTAARKFSETTGIKIVELDAINSQLGYGRRGKRITRAQWSRTYAEAFTRIRSALSAKRSVVFDATNFTRAQRDECRRVACECGADCAVVHVSISQAEAIERLLHNRTSRLRGDVRDEDFAHVCDMFEAPADDETIILL